MLQNDYGGFEILDEDAMMLEEWFLWQGTLSGLHGGTLDEDDGRGIEILDGDAVKMR